jgi:hypothetical protein
MTWRPETSCDGRVVGPVDLYFSADRISTHTSRCLLPQALAHVFLSCCSSIFCRGCGESTAAPAHDQGRGGWPRATSGDGHQRQDILLVHLRAQQKTGVLSVLYLLDAWAWLRNAPMLRIHMGNHGMARLNGAKSLKGKADRMLAAPLRRSAQEQHHVQTRQVHRGGGRRSVAVRLQAGVIEVACRYLSSLFFLSATSAHAPLLLLLLLFCRQCNVVAA